jgi:nitrite reductase/ring-hydroxylating ferredoxin subunit
LAGSGWFAVARSEELPPRHIVRTSLLGEELAVWRDDQGAINAWEDRCPHRGVRLTIGSNVGDALVCRYHGWRFASGSARCTVIPAHPGLIPGAALHVRGFAAAERCGYAWVSLDDDAGAPDVAALAASGRTTLRSIAVCAPAAAVAAALERLPSEVVPLLQPAEAGLTIVHVAVRAALAGEARRAALRAYDLRLEAWRDEVERG